MNRFALGKCAKEIRNSEREKLGARGLENERSLSSALDELFNSRNFCTNGRDDEIALQDFRVDEKPRTTPTTISELTIYVRYLLRSQQMIRECVAHRRKRTKNDHGESANAYFCRLTLTLSAPRWIKKFIIRQHQEETIA